MAYAPASVINSRLGNVNGGTSNYSELFQKIYMGEVMMAFERATITLDKHFIRTIPYGKSASFPIVGGTSAQYLTIGTDISTTAILRNEKVITIDGVLYSAQLIAELDELMNHFEVRSKFSMEQGRALANAFDTNIFKEIIKGARLASGSAYLTSSAMYGNVVTDSNLASSTAATKAQALVDAVYSAKALLEAKDVPVDQCWAAFSPANYNLIVKTVQSTGFSPISKDIGGSGSYASGEITEIGGIKILKSNNIPATDTSSTDTLHGVDADTTVGVVWTPDAVGTVKLMDLKVETAWDIVKQGTFIISKYAMGHSYLRPECCVELCSANPS